MRKSLLLLLFATLYNINVVAQSVTVHNFEIKYDYVKNGEKGILLKATFTVHGMKNRGIVAGFGVLTPDGQVVVSSNGTRLLIGHNLTPSYDDTKWTDLQSFIAYSYFPKAVGKHSLKGIFQVVYASDTNKVIYKDDGTNKSEINFTFTRSGQSSTPFYPTVPQYTPSMPAQAPICYKCNGLGYYYNANGNYTTCSQCGGGGRDWNSPTY